MEEASSMPDISFVMPVLNEEKYLETAVESIFAQEIEGQLELVLALGPSTDATDSIANALKKKHGAKLQLVKNPEGLTATALNLAIAKSKYEIVIRVDAHSELTPGYAKLGAEILLETGAANVGGMMVAKGKDNFQSAVAYGYNNKIGLGGGAFHIGGVAGPADTVYLGIFDKGILNKLGGFSKKWVRGQDWELNKRIREAGHLVWFDPRLQVGYYPRSSWKALAKQFLSTGIWRGALTRSAPAQSSAKYWVPPLLVIGSLFWFPFSAYLLAIGLYVFLKAKEPVSVKLWLMVVLPTMHFAWGLGFWWGLIKPENKG